MKKLVRDRIPEMLYSIGMRPFGVEELEDYKDKDYYLWKKFREEMTEFMSDPCVEELVDVIEVCRAIIGCQDDEIIKTLQDKRQNKGAFEKFYVMEFPHEG